MPLFLFRGYDEKFQRLLGALHRREAAIGACQQQCAFELAEHQRRDQIGLEQILTDDYESCAGYLPGECWGRGTPIKVLSNFANRKSGVSRIKHAKE
jgi:hypothetical protein